MDVDTVIADAFASADAQPQADATIEATKEATQETPEVTADEPSAPEVETKEEAFPKKAVNAISRRDKQIGKLRAQYEQAQAELYQLRERAAPQQTQSKEGPKEADFANYAEFMKAEMRHELGQELAKREGQQQETQRSIQERAWTAERESHVTAKAQEIVKASPELAAIIEEHADLADEFPPQIQKLFLAADNGPLAFAILAKEGKLEALASMSPALAAMEIGRAQTQAITKPVTKAPTPITPSKGTTGGKQLHQLSADALVDWINS